MPFTVSHIVAAIPFNNSRLGKYTALSPLIIGSMTPDVTYLIPHLLHQRLDSHSLLGIYLFCIPMGLTIYYLYHLLMAPVLVSFLPKTIQRHLNPDLLILEVVDENGAAVKNGALGEVIFTTLGVEGMPLLRYKTGDLCHVYYDKCTCGSSTPRLGPVLGRKQQMIKFKGTTIFPPAIFDVLDMMAEINIYQVEISKNEFGNDHITVILPNHLDNKAFHKKINLLYKSKLRVTPDLRYIDEDNLNQKVFNQEKRKPEKLVYV